MTLQDSVEEYMESLYGDSESPTKCTKAEFDEEVLTVIEEINDFYDGDFDSWKQDEDLARQAHIYINSQMNKLFKKINK